MGQITVSVVITTYNRAKLIARAIESVLNQAYRDFELIIVDDGSTDNTAEIVNSYNDKRIRYIRHEKNRGAAAARNTGIRAARCEYIAFQDSDDEWFSNKLEKQMMAFRDAPPAVGVVYSGVWYLAGRKRWYAAYPDKNRKDGDLHKSLLKLGYICFMASVVKKECFEKAGMFDEQLPTAEDWEMWIRISKYYHFKCIDEPLAYVYSAPGGHSSYRFNRALQMILAKHMEDFKSVRGLLSSYSLTVGVYLCLGGQFALGKSYIVNAIKANPLNIMAIIAGAISLLGEDAFNKIVLFYRKIMKRDLPEEI